MALVPWLLFVACGAGCGSRQAMPASALVLDGPPLAIAGDYDGMEFEGSMDRTCMSGFGTIALHGKDSGGQEFSCRAEVDAPPAENGRVRGILQCAGDRKLALSLRNLGPDQGVGVAREPGSPGLMIFFYHASREEALRRLPAVREDIAGVRKRAGR